jgi:hypothetical protein
MYVKVQNGYELDELHNVQAQSPSLKDTLWYDNTVSPAQWKTASIPTILGYTPENTSNKSTSVITDQSSNAKYPSVKSVYDWVTGLGYLLASSAASTYQTLANLVTSFGATPSDTKYPSEKLVKDSLDAKVTANAAITGATKTKITYDSKGLVTAGADIAASDLPSGIDAAKIANGSVSNTEFQYLDGVTSSIQTQLNSKTNSYLFFVQSQGINPADGNTYYINNIPNTPNQAVTNRLFKFINAGTLTSFTFSILQGVNGTSETVTIYLRNYSTSSEDLLGTFTSDFGTLVSTVISFTSLSISVNTTDSYSIKIVCPTWATNPTGWVIGGNLFIII